MLATVPLQAAGNIACQTGCRMICSRGSQDAWVVLELQLLWMQAVPGIIESSPGVRSCMIEYDQRVLPLAQLLDALEAIDKKLPAVSGLPHLELPVRECSLMTAQALTALLHVRVPL